MAQSDPLYNADRESVTAGDARCWRCEGSGMVQYEDQSGTFTHHQLCSKCQGTGRARAAIRNDGEGR